MEIFSRRGALRAGYGAVLAVLIVSAGEAYRIQASLSRQHLEIYRHYVDEDAALAELRRNLWSAASDIRDFFISTTPAQAGVLTSELDALRADNQRTLDYLDRTYANSDVAPKLRKSLGEFWAIAEPLPRAMLRVSKQKQFDFLQREIVPRRGELNSALLELAAVDRERLQASEREFAETRRHAAERLLIMLGLGMVLSLVVARLSLRHAENLEQRAESHYAEVERARSELQQLSARLLEVEEQGKRRLARELHDEIGQTLALLQIEISRAQAMLPAQPAAARERLQWAREMAEKTVQTIRNISVLLRPSILDDLGLVPALHFQLEEFMKRSGIHCEFTNEGVADELPDAVKTSVYRLVQEALHNCEKHSGATCVRVGVRQFSDYLVAEVEDNGCGFALNEQRMPSVKTGLGLLGLRERAAAAGGGLIIDSAPGEGTRIAFRIPVAARQEVTA
jgi:signal transduction histidine kinase